jgi:hypothetical protein
MKLLPVTFIALLLSVSCKEQDKEKEPPTEVFRFGKEISPERSLTDKEFELVRTTCTDLQNKRIFFEERGDRELRFNYDLREKGCNDNNYLPTTEVFSSLRVPRSGDVFFEAPRVGNFASDILTDSHPSMEAVCTDVLNGINVTNTITSGTVKYQYRYITAREGAILEIAKFAQNVSGIYMPTFIESFSILSSSYKQLSGMVYERFRVSPCSNNSSQIYRQTLKR